MPIHLRGGLTMHFRDLSIFITFLKGLNWKWFTRDNVAFVYYLIIALCNFK